MKRNILIRLDDACEYMDIPCWQRIEDLLNKYDVKPLVGIIPHCEDDELMRYGYDKDFWQKVEQWKSLGWTFALHGYNHVYQTDSGGLNPINKRSEFAGVKLDEQCCKIREGVKILEGHGLEPKIFFAPSHTFDRNTLKAIKSESKINIISDGIADDVFFEEGFYFIPQQVGKPIKLPLSFVTICLHPNIMKEVNFNKLESFLRENHNLCISIDDIVFKNRGRSLYDNILRFTYFLMHNIKKCLNFGDKNEDSCSV